LTPDESSGWKDAVFKGPGFFYILVALFFAGVIVINLLGRCLNPS